MKNQSLYRRIRMLAILALAFLLPPAHFSAAPPELPDSPAAPIAPAVLQQMAVSGQASCWVILAGKADLSRAFQIADWNARGQYVYDQLTSFAEAKQRGLVSLLTRSGVQFTSYWIVNAIYVTSGEAILHELSRQPAVKEIVAPFTVEIPEAAPAAQESGTGSIEWNIDRINAPQVWSTYADTGTGIVVASIDTGVQYDHPALVDKYRGNLGGGHFDHNYNWFDPSSACPDPSVPCDNNGIGTHDMGVMVGDDGGSNQIGVAPGARFIAAKGCESGGCSGSALMASAQWILAPTDLTGANPRPDLRPHVVSNSWSSTTGGDNWFQPFVQAWVASGIFPVFLVGLGGAGCGTAGSPGDYPESYAVGFFDSSNVISAFSRNGPSAFGGIIKPNITAPGVSVRSSVPANSYAAYTGGASASAHVAGTVALVLAASPTLIGDITHTRLVLDQSAIDTSNTSCGGTPGNNNVWGEGRLDAFAAVKRSLIGGADIPIWIDGLENITPAVAYNSNHDEYFVVWSTWQDDYTHDLWARRVDSQGNFLGPQFNVATGPGEKRSDPTVVYNPQRDEYLVAYTYCSDECTEFNIYAKRVAWDGGYLSGEIHITQFTTDTHVSPAVAYNSLDDEYLVVFTNQWGDGLMDIYAQRLRGVDGALLTWSDVIHDVAADRSSPTVAYSAAANGGNGGYLIAYFYHIEATSAYQIRGKVSQSYLGDLYTNPEIPICTSGAPSMHPVVATGREGYLAIWWASTAGGVQIRGRRVTTSGAPLGGTDGFEVSPLYNWPYLRAPALAHGAGFGYLAVWQYDTVVPTSFDIHARYVMDGQDSASGSVIIIDDSGPPQDFPAVACAPSGDCLVVYTWSKGSSSDIAGRFVNLHHRYLPLLRK